MHGFNKYRVINNKKYECPLQIMAVNDEAEQWFDFKHRKWEFPIAAKVRTVDGCLLTITKTKQVCERLLLSPLQDRDPEVSGLYEIAFKWLRTRVGNPCIDALDTDNETNTPTFTDSFAVTALDTVYYTTCQHLTEFL